MRNEGRKIIKHDGKMLPEGARRVSNEGLEASGAPLGAIWARSGRLERLKSLWVAAWGGPGGDKKFMGPAPGASWRKKLIGFTLGGSQGGSRGGSGRPFWEIFLRQGLPALQKT